MAKARVKAGARRRRQANKPPRVLSPGKNRIIGLDVSSVCVGYSVFDDGNLVAYGKYHQVGTEHGEKLANFRLWVEKLITDLSPDQVVVEQPYPGQRRHTFGVLSMYVAVVLAAHWGAFKKEVPKENRVPAHRVKRILGVPKGQTHAQNKEIMVKEINRRHGTGLRFRKASSSRHTTDDDVADAIAVVDAWLIIQADESGE